MTDAPAFDASTSATGSLRDIYVRMTGSWDQVSRDIRRSYEESRSLSAGRDTDVADFLQSCASDCLPDGDSSGSGVWQVTFAVRGETGGLQSFPLLLVPQELCESVSHPTCADAPLHFLSGAKSREWVPADPRKPLRLRHAFVIHVCDLLVRPFGGVVATTVQYDVEKLQLTYIVNESRVDAKSVFSFLSALAQAKKDDRKQPSGSSSGHESQPASSSSSNAGDRESGASKDAMTRDAFCPITLGNLGLRAAHMCHLSLGQQVYAWIMESLVDECKLSKRYDLTPWSEISTWDINATTNSMVIHPGLKISDTWTLLPQSLSDVDMPHLVFPTNCTTKCTFWDEPEPLVARRYVFLNFRPGEIAPTLFKYEASIRNLPFRCGNLTGITPVFVEKKRAREETDAGREADAKRRKTEKLPEDGGKKSFSTDRVPPPGSQSPPPVAPSRDVLEKSSPTEDRTEGLMATISTEMAPPLGSSSTQTAPPAGADPSQEVPESKPKKKYLRLGPRQPRRPTEAPRLRRPTAPSSYWPESAAYPPPIAWDAMCASRIVLHYGSFAVKCFESVGAEDVEALIAALPQHFGESEAAAGAETGCAGRPLASGAPSSPTSGRGDLGTVFLLSVLLLAACYSAAGGDDDEDDDEYLSLLLVSREKASSRRDSLLSWAASVGNGDRDPAPE